MAVGIPITATAAAEACGFSPEALASQGVDRRLYAGLTAHLKAQGFRLVRHEDGATHFMASHRLYAEVNDYMALRGITKDGRPPLTTAPAPISVIAERAGYTRQYLAAHGRDGRSYSRAGQRVAKSGLRMAGKRAGVAIYYDTPRLRDELVEAFRGLGIPPSRVANRLDGCPEHDNATRCEPQGDEVPLRVLAQRMGYTMEWLGERGYGHNGYRRISRRMTVAPANDRRTPHLYRDDAATRLALGRAAATLLTR